MSQEILEKTNEISEGITEYMKTAADYAGGLGDAAGMAYKGLRRSFDRDIEGFVTGPSSKPIQFGALLDLGTKAIKRGAGSGAFGGAAGGAALGGSIASGGLPAIVAGFGRGAAKGAAKGRGGIGKIASALTGGLTSVLGAGTRGAIGAGLGGAVGGLAGFKGGRQTGAKLAGAGALGAPAALIGGPLAGAALGAGGAAVSSDIAKALETARARMAAGGGQGIIFRP